MRAGEGPFVRDGICQKIICLEKYVSGFIQVLGRAEFTLAVPGAALSPQARVLVQTRAGFTFHARAPYPSFFERGALAGRTRDKGNAKIFDVILTDEQLNCNLQR